MYPPFVLKSQKIEESGDFYSYQILFYSCRIVSDPLFLSIPDPISFMPDPKYSYRILSFYSYRILFHLCRIWNTHTGSFFIHAESKFTELLLTIPESSNIIVNWPLVWELFVPGLKTDEWNWVTDQFHENKKITGSNIFKRIPLAYFLLKQSYRATSHAIAFNYRPVKIFIFT